MLVLAAVLRNRYRINNHPAWQTLWASVVLDGLGTVRYRGKLTGQRKSPANGHSAGGMAKGRHAKLGIVYSYFFA
jgi:hypothetical protein